MPVGPVTSSCVSQCRSLFGHTVVSEIAWLLQVGRNFFDEFIFHMFEIVNVPLIIIEYDTNFQVHEEKVQIIEKTNKKYVSIV